ncbi:uncharacterized protein PHACADRAFT_198555 [Phanerochaete carnosa HHB-10118-sp]|uniref:Uncharacterized protein n=1 Tax=Phanerochaete carnosa (strain HHB-10118-sp) TaxID=650164 RepID=K5W0U6_PHACS|nr:uncharacterized protein PHACADRAFT_198555 [Phanerochaete carnosa HHB-10118-sp]EKM52499.1 hypothetical protein PHACADRAFT_198555 [Phanerochaete carnosa HHB-10118-sp]
MSSSVASSSVGVSAPTASSSPGPNVEPNGSPSLLSSQASLYLYTFLVTLILLLAVSGAIVTRSFIMRRRHRRMVEEAIRNGTYVPPSKTKKELGQKPAIYDAFLSVDGAVDLAVGGKSKGRSTVPALEEMRWEDTLPVSTLLLNHNGSPYHGFQEHRAEKPSVAPPFRQGRDWRSILFLGPLPYLASVFSGSRSPTPTGNADSISSSPTSASPEHTANVKVQPPQCARVSVMIAMPQLPRLHAAQSSPPLSSISSPLPLPSSCPSLAPHEKSTPEPLSHLELGIADVRLGRWEEGDVQDIAD